MPTKTNAPEHATLTDWVTVLAALTILNIGIPALVALVTR